MRKILGRELLQALCPAINLDFSVVQRVVIDVAFNDIVRVYVQQVGDERLLALDWPGHLKDAEIRTERAN